MTVTEASNGPTKPKDAGLPRSYSAGSGLTGLTRISNHSKNFFGADDDFYNLKEVLGEGSFGSVYRAQRISNSQVCAVKIIDPRQLGFVGGEDGIKAVEVMAAREVDALKQMHHHPGIVSLMGAFYSETTRQIFIVTEFVAHGNLFSLFVGRTEAFDETEAAYIVAQLTDALSFCHALGVVHRDLKLENVLVANIDVRVGQKCINGKVLEAEAIELFKVKICDFGFAKALKGYSTATPIGTENYSAPEVALGDKSIETLQETIKRCSSSYDAFKADIFSLGVMVWVMLSHSYPVKDAGEGAHRMHKVWPYLSEEAKSFIDGLLRIDPEKRFDILQANNHKWLRLANVPNVDEETEASVSRNSSKDDLPLSPTLRPAASNRELQGILSLQRAFVMMQQERAMACWALSNVGDFEGISCWDDLRHKVQLTDKRMGEAKKQLYSGGSDRLNAIVGLIQEMAKARKLVFSNCPSAEQTDPGHDENGSRGDAGEMRDVGGSTFDGVFLAYNHACTHMIDLVAKSLEQVRPGSNVVRRAARRYRLFSTAVEQLGRERAFIIGQGIRPYWYSGKRRIDAFAPEKLRSLGEILGARKVLLGTSGKCGPTMSGDIVANSNGLLGMLLGPNESPLMSTAEMAQLESIEERVIACDGSVGADEWYRMLTHLMTSIHSRIAIDLVNDMHQSQDDEDDGFTSGYPYSKRDSFSIQGSGKLLGSPHSSKGHLIHSEEESPESCCQAGLRKLFGSADR